MKTHTFTFSFFLFSCLSFCCVIHGYKDFQSYQQECWPEFYLMYSRGTLSVNWLKCVCVWMFSSFFQTMINVHPQNLTLTNRWLSVNWLKCVCVCECSAAFFKRWLMYIHKTLPLLTDAASGIALDMLYTSNQQQQPATVSVQQCWPRGQIHLAADAFTTFGSN